MATGETDVSQYSSYLLLGWDGHTLQWSRGHAGQLIEAGEETSVDSIGFKNACLQLKKRGFGEESVVFHHRHAFFTVAPASVAKGHEEQLMALHLGTREGTKSDQSFHSDAFGDELVVMERWESDALRLEVQNIWPHVQFESSSLRWLEKVGADSRAASSPLIAVDIGNSRALLARLDEGKLMWAMVTEDLEGEGLLYHIVNALHRDGLEPESSKAKVLLSGNVELEDVWFSVFERFFTEVEIVQSEMEVPGMKTQRWALHSYLATCV